VIPHGIGAKSFSGLSFTFVLQAHHSTRQSSLIKRFYMRYGFVGGEKFLQKVNNYTFCFVS